MSAHARIMKALASTTVPPENAVVKRADLELLLKVHEMAAAFDEGMSNPTDIRKAVEEFER